MIWVVQNLSRARARMTARCFLRHRPWRCLNCMRFNQNLTNVNEFHQKIVLLLNFFISWQKNSKSQKSLSKFGPVAPRQGNCRSPIHYKRKNFQGSKKWPKIDFSKSSQNDLKSIVLHISMILSTFFHVFVRKNIKTLKKLTHQNSEFRSSSILKALPLWPKCQKNWFF